MMKLKIYLKNGYRPYELVSKAPQHNGDERIQITDYVNGKVMQEELRRKLNSEQVIFIFKKIL